MITANRTNVVQSHFFVIAASSPPLPREDTEDNYYNRRRGAAWLPSANCTCLLSVLAGLALIALLTMSIVIPIIVTFSTMTNEISSTASTTTIVTTSNITTATSTTSTVTTSTTATSTTSTVTTSTTATSTTSTVTTSTSTTSTTATSTTSTTATSTTSTSTVTTSTTTTTTTDIPCTKVCTSRETCEAGVCVGIGYLSCTLTWSRAGDGDLVLRTPNNHVIYWNNAGPSFSTDQGYLDVDDKNGTGPENIFWSNTSSIPPTGTYYVCFEPYLFNPNASLSIPITATVK
ncbi:unnamed protein product, partial [Rotaria sp. Silwood1]